MGSSASYPHQIFQLLWGYLWVQLWCPNPHKLGYGAPILVIRVDHISTRFTGTEPLWDSCHEL